MSVIVASYNHARFLDERIQSLLNQTYKNLEIIIVDDKSIDESIEIIESYKSDSRLKLLENESNMGWIETSNRGYFHSKGKYVMFANCDDSCDPAQIETLVTFLEKEHNLGLVFSRSKLIDEEGRVLGDDFNGREKEFKRICNGDTTIEASKFRNLLSHSCVIPNLSAALISRKAFSELNGFSNAYNICSDWDFYLRLSKNFSAGYVYSSLNNFRQHNMTIRSINGNEKILMEISRLLLRQDLMSDLGIFPSFRAKFHVSRIFWEYVLNRQIFQSLKLLRLAKNIVLMDSIMLIVLPIGFFIRISNLFSRQLSISK